MEELSGCLKMTLGVLILSFWLFLDESSVGEGWMDLILGKTLPDNRLVFFVPIGTKPESWNSKEGYYSVKCLTWKH